MSTPAKRLWDKGSDVDALVHAFTVGDDPLLDRGLVHWDCLGSAAHAWTLAKAGLLTDEECRTLIAGLREIDDQARDGRFEIPVELEDCHTAIEAALVERCGEVGQRIHAGRSRNDQVATAMRLYMRRATLDLLSSLDAFVGVLLERGGRDGATPMPGYTHLQPAMPSSVGQWLHAHSEAALDQLRAGLDLLQRLDACPLGTGAGYGVPLPLDRRLAADLLGFERVQRSPIDVQNSRGRMEKYFVRVAADVGAVLERFSSDLVLFASAEFGLVTLPEALTTGSSIMPQKRNPDVVELLRARAARLRASVFELEAVTGKLTSGYHRDLQLTKGPAIRAAGEIEQMLAVATTVAGAVRFNQERLAELMRSELYATHAAYALVREGVPFREAYRRVAADVASGRFAAPVIHDADASGLVASETWEAVAADAADLKRRATEAAKRYSAAEARLLDSDA